MHVLPFDPTTATAADLDEYVRVQLAAAAGAASAEPAATPQSLLARLTRLPAPDRRYLHWTARDAPGSPLAGAADLSLVGHRHSDLAAIRIAVHPDYRGRGIATHLLRALTMAAADRACLLIEGLPDGSTGQAWADKLGFAVVQQTVQLTLDLTTADRGRWQLPGPAGYRLARWTGSTPDELLVSYAAARNAIREAPHGGLSFTEPAWTPDGVRDEEATSRARACELRVAVALHRPTGQVAGLTYLEVHQSRPELAVQQDTAVVQSHRGHGLGAWIKAANLRQLTADRPEVTLVTTSNAADNEHMLRVNQQVGFQVAARTEIREASVAGLTERLNR